MNIEKELKSFPQFLSTSPNNIKQLNHSAKGVFFKEGDKVINRGEQVGGIYLVVSGCLRVYTVDTNGNEGTLYDIKSGESCMLATNCVFSRLLYPAWVSASSPLTKVLVIPSSLFRKIYASEKSVQEFVFSMQSQRIFNLMSILEEALSYSVEQRIASYLIRKSNLNGEVKTSHQKIALEIGSAREVVSRTLKKLETQKVLVLSRGLIRIDNKKALNRFL